MREDCWRRCRALWRFEVGLLLTVGGIFWLPNGFFQVLILLCWSFWPAIRHREWDYRAALADPLIRGFAAWLILGLVMTIARLTSVERAEPWWMTLVHALNGLVLFGFVLLGRQAVAKGWGYRMAMVYVASGVIAVSISFVVYYGPQGNPFPGGRLHGVLVYPPDGLHTVLTGLLAASATVLACGVYVARPSWKWLGAIVILVAAVFFTYSRGALLSLVGGTVGLMILAGVRRSLLPMVLCFVTYAGWGFSAPYLAEEDEKTRGMVPLNLATRNTSPAREMLVRADSGRVVLWQFLWKHVDSWDKHLFGMGLSGKRRAAYPDIQWTEPAPHPHSLYFGIYLTSGAIGLTLFLGLLGLAAWKAFTHRHRSVEIALWGSLLTAGAVGLLFDGDVPATFWSVTRLEPLLIWLPWAAIVGTLTREDSPAGPGEA